MPSGKKRKRHKVATHKKKRDVELIVTRKRLIEYLFFLIIININLSSLKYIH